jgi:hypothetical protein
LHFSEECCECELAEIENKNIRKWERLDMLVTKKHYKINISTDEIGKINWNRVYLSRI